MNTMCEINSYVISQWYFKAEIAYLSSLFQEYAQKIYFHESDSHDWK